MGLDTLVMILIVIVLVVVMLMAWAIGRLMLSLWAEREALREDHRRRVLERILKASKESHRADQ